MAKKHFLLCNLDQAIFAGGKSINFSFIPHMRIFVHQGRAVDEFLWLKFTCMFFFLEKPTLGISLLSDVFVSQKSGMQSMDYWSRKRPILNEVENAKGKD